MRVLCNEDILDVNQNYFRILGAGYGESYLRWKKGKLYNAFMGSEMDLSIDTYIYLESEVIGSNYPMKEKFFNENFSTIEEVRDRKIEELLK